MIPLRDNIRHRNFPVLTLALILLNVAVFAYQFHLEHSPYPWRSEILVGLGGVVPAALVDPEERKIALDYLEQEVQRTIDQRYGSSLFLSGSEIRSYRNESKQIEQDFDWAREKTPNLGLLTLLTSLFLHGGIFHLLGNMWFLWIFGNNVEDRIGKLRFLFFYLICGVAAGLTHYFTNQDSVVPTIGASGAIGGVLGAYVALFPQAKVLTLIPIFFFLFLREIPAWIFLGIWFLLEWFSAALFFSQDRAAGGIAHWAHVGGFLAGFLLIRLFALGRPSQGAISYRIR